MKLLFSVPTGYHLRELVMPLRRHIEENPSIHEVHIFTPAAPIASDIFREFGSKFIYHENPKDDSGHRELLSSIKPDIAITNTVGHDELDEPILRISKELNIPTLTFIASWDNVWKIERLMNANIPVAIAERFIVWNTMMKEYLMRVFPEVSENRIAIIGAPRLDYFFQPGKIASKEEVYAKLGLEDISRPFIHIATTELYPMEYITKSIAEAVATQEIPNNPYLYASVHPGGSLEKYTALEKYGAVIKFSSGRREDITLPSFRYAPVDADIFFLAGVFTHGGVLVNHSSTVALESIIAGVPVVNVRYGMSFDWWRWYRSMVYRDFQQHYADLIGDGATYVARSQKELIQDIVLGFANPHAHDAERAITIKKMITTTDGTASKKVLDFIMQK